MGISFPFRLIFRYESIRQFCTQKLLKTGQGNDITGSSRQDIGARQGCSFRNTGAKFATVMAVTSRGRRGLDHQGCSHNRRS
jgi:hypothetical protein